MRVAAVALAVAVTSVLQAGCGGDDADTSSTSVRPTTPDSASTDTSGGPTGTPTTTAAEPENLRILVTNDDGYDAEGIDVLVEALRALPNVEITVVAPATNRSGTGSQTTPGAVTATQQETTSGYQATAVDGFPADAVVIGLSQVLSEPPDLVVAGINQGQNLGPLAAISGTVGAAKAAAAAGIPALAVSQGLADMPDYQSAAGLIVEYLGDRQTRCADRRYRRGRHREPQRADMPNGGGPRPEADASWRDPRLRSRFLPTAPLPQPRSLTTARPSPWVSPPRPSSPPAGEPVTTSTTWPAAD